MEYLTCRAATHNIHANTQTNTLFQFAKWQKPFGLIPPGMAATYCNAATVADCGNSRQEFNRKSVWFLVQFAYHRKQNTHTHTKIYIYTPYNNVSSLSIVGVMNQQQNTSKLTKLGKKKKKQQQRRSLTCGIKQKLLELNWLQHTEGFITISWILQKCLSFVYSMSNLRKWKKERKKS